MPEQALTSASPVKIGMSSIQPNRRRGGDLRVLLSPATVGATAGFMGVVTLEPGEFVSEHYHPYSEEFIFLAHGMLTVRLDGQPVPLSAGESVLVGRNIRHRLENHGDGAAFAVFQLAPLAPRPELGHVDTEEPPHPDAPSKGEGQDR